MKVSQEQKRETRLALIDAAVEQVIEKGLKGATMRAIARQAGVGDATIYNYFPTKESLLFAYYEERILEATETVRARKGYGEYRLQERVQTLFEELLERMLPDREFVQVTAKPVFFSMAPNHGELKPAQEPFFEYVGEAIDIAVHSGEIEEQVFRDMIVRLYWDHFLGIVFYWLGDRSEMFADTSILADKTLGLGAAALKAGMANKTFDICSFLFRNHVLTYFQGHDDRMDSIRRIGRAFMEGTDGNTGS